MVSPDLVSIGRGPQAFYALPPAPIFLSKFGGCNKLRDTICRKYLQGKDLFVDSWQQWSYGLILILQLRFAENSIAGTLLSHSRHSDQFTEFAGNDLQWDATKFCLLQMAAPETLNPRRRHVIERRGA